MFDQLICKKELPLNEELKSLDVKWNEVIFQTKDLDNCLCDYIITKDGELVEDVKKYENTYYTEEEIKQRVKEKKWSFIKDSKLVEQYNKKVNYHGFLDRKQVADVMKGSIYLSLDINPACPNTDIEALSNSAPVVAFNTGAIPELIDNSCGAVVDYGSNPWELAYPDVKAMFADILEVAEDYQSKSMNARFKAEKEYNNYDIVDKYLKVIGQMK